MHSAQSQPVEFRLQIAVELGAATDPVTSRPGGGARGPSPVQQFLESAHALISELALGLDVGMVWLTSPSGVRLLVEGSAESEDLAAIRTAATALGQVPSAKRA
jgi:hypothetical protein